MTRGKKEKVTSAQRAALEMLEIDAAKYEPRLHQLALVDALRGRQTDGTQRLRRQIEGKQVERRSLWRTMPRESAGGGAHRTAGHDQFRSKWLLPEAVRLRRDGQSNKEIDALLRTMIEERAYERLAPEGKLVDWDDQALKVCDGKALAKLLERELPKRTKRAS